MFFFSFFTRARANADIICMLRDSTNRGDVEPEISPANVVKTDVEKTDDKFMESFRSIINSIESLH